MDRIRSRKMCTSVFWRPGSGTPRKLLVSQHNTRPRKPTAPRAARRRPAVEPYAAFRLPRNCFQEALPAKIPPAASATTIPWEYQMLHTVVGATPDCRWPTPLSSSGLDPEFTNAVVLPLFSGPAIRISGSEQIGRAHV